MAVSEAMGWLFFDVHVVVFPGGEATLKFHDGEIHRGELHAGIGGQMTLLRIAVDNVGFLFAEALGMLPTVPRQVDGAGDVALGEIFRLTDVHDDKVVLAGFYPSVQFDRAGREGQFVLEISPRAGGGMKLMNT